MAKANLKEMEALHKALANYYTSILDAEGEMEVSSGTLAAVNAFLKNNDIKVDIVESDPLQNIQYKLSNLIEETA